jgi:hypothetical protein
MTISVVACGQSAKDWYNTPCDKSIGVNDCLKHGRDTDYLVCVNAPFKFEPNKSNGRTDRKKIILSSNARFMTSLCMEWLKYKKSLDCININPFTKWLKKGTVYHSKTSPFVAMSIAFNMGAKDIILWGVDFIDHPDFPQGKRNTQFEIEQYVKFADMAGQQGCKVWIGNEGTSLNKYFPVYDIDQIIRSESIAKWGESFRELTKQHNCNG